MKQKRYLKNSQVFVLLLDSFTQFLFLFALEESLRGLRCCWWPSLSSW